MKIEIFKGKSCLAEYNREKKRMFYSFDGYALIDEHKAMYLKALEFMKTHNTTTFVMDFRKIKGTFTSLNDWVIETFRPAIETGLSKSAMVLNEDIFTAFAANDAIKKVKLIQIQVFKSIGDAEKWLDE